METLLLLISSAVFGTITFRLRNGTSKFIKETIDNLYGGSIEELLDETIEDVSENGLGAFKTFFKSKKNENKKKLLKELAQYIESLGKEEEARLVSYLKAHEISLEKISPELANLTSPSLDEKARKKAVEKALKKTEEKAFANVHFRTPAELGALIFHDSAENVPTELIDIIRIINRHVFEIKYIKQSGEERDVVKLVQYIIEDSPLLGDVKKMLEQMKDYFDLMTQQNAHPDFRMNDIKSLDSLAKKDPFFFVRLQCPICEASGSMIEREGERATCHCCGEVFDIIRND